MTLKERLKDHEGFRAEIYRCPAGHWTIGYGHFLGNGNCKISPQVADLILEEDIHCATFNYLSMGWDLGPARNDVMIEMIFWHGLKGFLKFKKMITAVEKEDWDEVAAQMMDSNSGRDYAARMTTLAMLMIEG
ncbi:MAG: hypothetical protein BBJ60_00015 [Desulfobacterales bacterium S7086C20]|nr:MAG: hypothetical protein BBJ60_00015 [Desulfobacterales bacterium S7086C20]